MKVQSTKITTAVKKAMLYPLDYSTSCISFHFSSLINSSSKQDQLCLITTVRNIYLYLKKEIEGYKKGPKTGEISGRLFLDSRRIWSISIRAE